MHPRVKGFSILEITLYIGVFSTVMLVVTYLLITVIQERVKSQTIAEVEEEGRSVMEIISQTARNAQAINLPEVGSPDSMLSLEVDDVAKNPTEFYLKDEVIYIKEGPNPELPLTVLNRVSVPEFTVSQLQNQSLKISFRIRYRPAGDPASNRYEYNYEKRFDGAATLRR